MMNKENLEYIKNQIDTMLIEIYDNKDKLRIVKGKIEEGVIINGNPLGYDKIQKDIYQLDKIIDNLNNVRNNCVRKLELIEQNGSINNENINNSGDN